LLIRACDIFATNAISGICGITTRGLLWPQVGYVLLISADDRLRSPHLLQRYVHLLDDNPTVGYVCCPGMRLENGIEAEVEGCLADHDMVLEGKAFLFKLLRGNFIIAASGMVRRVCYEKYGAFPLDLPYAGDWFLWCLFAVLYDVAYCAEPMVNYRRHELSMTNYLMSQRRRLTLREGFIVLWRIETEARLAIREAFGGLGDGREPLLYNRAGA
jgi:hypothetical protein